MADKEVRKIKALAQGSHRIGDVIYEFDTGETFEVSKEHYDVMIKLKHLTTSRGK